MTLKEAIKILKKEGFHMILEKKVIYQNGAIREFEKQEVCEAIKVANENRLTVGLTPIEWNEREARLKKEHEENTKDPDSAENHIKEYSSENPALAESASQFNDALLDEQGKKIKRFGKEIARLNNIIRKKNLKIAEKDEVIDNLGKELAEQYKELTSKEKEINELLFKFEGARSFLLRSQRENEEKCKAEESLLKRIDEMELMLKQREGMLRLSDAGNDFKDAMLDHISKSYDKSQKRIAAFMYNSLSKSKELGNGLVERMEPIRRKRKKTKK